MGVFSFSPGEPVPRNEPQYGRPGRAARRPGPRPGSPLATVQLAVDLTLAASPRPASQQCPAPQLELGVATQHQQRLLLEHQTEDETIVSKLAKPAWPKSSPTIPSTFFKGTFQEKVSDLHTYY